ncbi:MAG: urease accessory protein UreD [Cyanobacteriota bacterium]|nr:urease accessory protein UreD [Cyanobacteriota bacterium]
MARPVAPGWQGLARLSYDYRAGSSVASQTFSQAPLRVQRSLYPEGPQVCHTVVVHTAGGLVAGDRLSLEVTLQPHSRALITTAAASKVYGREGEPTPEQMAQQTTTLTLAPHSCLEWFPQETIVFNAAHYRQHLRVNLAPGAVWCGWDITRFGRSARQERFCQGDWRSQLQVWQEGDTPTPLWIDPQALAGGSPALDSINGLGGQPVVGCLVLVGLELSVEQVHQLRSQPGVEAPGQVGITRLQQGVVCRYRGPSSQGARQWFMGLWRQLRPWYLGRPAILPRVWFV